LTQAIRDVAAHPQIAGSARRPEIAASARTYHHIHSRERVAGNVGRVRRPRHFLLYRVRPIDTVEIGRLLHDSMDLSRHVPDEYRPKADDD
jgi:toxin ParE1/3/4